MEWEALHFHYSFLSLSKRIHTIFRIRSHFGHGLQGCDAPITMMWQWGLWSKAKEECEWTRGEKAQSQERRISFLPYQSKLQRCSFEVWEGENFPGINSMICLHLVPTKNKPPVHWPNVAFNSCEMNLFQMHTAHFLFTASQRTRTCQFLIFKTLKTSMLLEYLLQTNL